MNKYLERALENFKDPEFVIKIWQRMCILAFTVGILIGAIFTQTYNVNQVNEVFDQAREQDGCFDNFFRMNYGGSLWQEENITSIVIDGITYNTSKPN